MWEDDPRDGSDVLSVKWILWLTSWPRAHRTAPVASEHFPSFLLSFAPTQTNQSTCVLTPKSHSLTCPRVFTSILEGLTSVKTNCLIELQNQHSAACLYQLCTSSFFFFTQQSYSPLWSIFRLHKYVRPFTTYGGKHDKKNYKLQLHPFSLYMNKNPKFRFLPFLINQTWKHNNKKSSIRIRI